MLSYLIRRIGGSIIVLFIISIMAFILVYAIPADPARMILGPKAAQSVVNSLRHQLGLDQPLWVQYFRYVGNLLQGNLGTSYVYDQPVTTLIGQRLGPTAWLALGSWVAELIIGIPLGIYTARHARKLRDYIASALALVGVSLLVPWLGLVLLYFFAFKIPIFPLGGYGGIYHLILPSLTFGITGAAAYTRLLKSSMLEVLGQDFVRTARAKGSSERRVIWRHVLRNAMIPVVTYGGIDIGYLLSGVVLLEVAFNWNGLGTLAYNAISQMDIPTIMGTVLLTALVVVVFNLIVDLLYAFIDPRVRLG